MEVGEEDGPSVLLQAHCGTVCIKTVLFGALYRTPRAFGYTSAGESVMGSLTFPHLQCMTQSFPRLKFPQTHGYGKLHNFLKCYRDHVH